MNSRKICKNLIHLKKGDRVELTNCFFSSPEMMTKAAKNGFPNYIPQGVFISTNKDGANVMLDVNAMVDINHKWSTKEKDMQSFDGKKITQEQGSRIVTDLDADNIILIYKNK